MAAKREGKGDLPDWLTQPDKAEKVSAQQNAKPPTSNMPSYAQDDVEAEPQHEPVPAPTTEKISLDNETASGVAEDNNRAALRPEDIDIPRLPQRATLPEVENPLLPSERDRVSDIDVIVTAAAEEKRGFFNALSRVFQVFLIFMAMLLASLVAGFLFGYLGFGL